MKDSKHYYGYKLSRGYRSATVWVFDRLTNKLVGTLKRTCAPKLGKSERGPELARFLKHFGITLS